MKMIAFIALLLCSSLYAQDIDYNSIFKDKIHTAEAITELNIIAQENGTTAERFYMQDSIKIQFKIIKGSKEDVDNFFETTILPMVEEKRNQKNAEVESFETEDFEYHIWADLGAGGCLMRINGSANYFVEISSFNNDFDFFRAFYKDIDFGPLIRTK